jgi:heterodisulfide reductase subunit C
VTDYNEALEEEIAALPGGEYIHRCWQCGSCTNSCTVNAINPDFNPRYWIYLIRVGMESELLRDKDIIWQCVSCNKCTYACPRDVFPEGVMKATSHWLERKGHTPKSPSMHFDEVFTEQIVKRRFFARTKQGLFQDWMIEMVKRMLRGLPIGMLTRMGLSTFVAPRTSNWGAASKAMQEYIDEQEHKHEEALNLAALAKRPERDVAA